MSGDPTLTSGSSLTGVRRAPRRALGLTLVFSGGTRRAGEQVALSQATGAELGRDAALFGTPLGDSRMSRAHCAFEHRARRWQVRDLGSKNGTFVNGRPATDEPLQPGDVVRTGDTFVVFAPVPESSTAPGELVGVGEAIAAARLALARVADSTHTVLLQGETGTGKEVAARQLHRLSRRRGALVAVNCASLRGELLESELFGHVRGAFTGADREREGLFRRADGGTLLLDEVGEIAPDVQARLLRALEERSVRPVGGTRDIAIDTRVVAATNLPLEAAVRDGAFRSDLYARLARWIVTLPPLRERREDLGVLVRALLDRESPQADVTADLIEALLHHSWPLNVRGLDNALVAAVISSAGSPELDLTAPVREALEKQASLVSREPPSDGAFESRLPDAEELRARLEAHRGKVASVARELGASRQQIYRLLERYGLTPDAFR